MFTKVGEEAADYLVDLVRPGASKGSTGGLPTPSKESISPALDASRALETDMTWPTMRGCDGATAVGMPVDGPDIANFSTENPDLRAAVSKAGGGAWQVGHLSIEMSAAGDKRVSIVNLRPKIEELAADTGWTYTPQGGCGDSFVRSFDLDLDRRTIVDKGIQGADAAQDGISPRAEPLGPSFTVTQDERAMVVVHTRACNANYKWLLDVQYVVDGATHFKRLGPFISLSRLGTATRFYTSGPGQPTILTQQNSTSC
jgi:hypothetical protein